MIGCLCSSPFLQLLPRILDGLFVLVQRSRLGPGKIKPSLPAQSGQLKGENVRANCSARACLFRYTPLNHVLHDVYRQVMGHFSFTRAEESVRHQVTIQAKGGVDPAVLGVKVRFPGVYVCAVNISVIKPAHVIEEQVF